MSGNKPLMKQIQTWIARKSESESETAYKISAVMYEDSTIAIAYLVVS